LLLKKKAKNKKQALLLKNKKLRIGPGVFIKKGQKGKKLV
jgi:hypothetical protein